MDIISFLYDSWVISIASIILSLAVSPLIIGLGRRIASVFGRFTGDYIALTFQPDGESVLIEIVKCWQVGDSLRGRIIGVTFGKYRGQSFVETYPNASSYKFNGFVDERLFVISYATVIRRAKGAGTLTLHGNSTGSAFEGVWSGFDSDQIMSNRCIWFPVSKRVSLSKDRNIILSSVGKFIEQQGLITALSSSTNSLPINDKRLTLAQPQISNEAPGNTSRTSEVAEKLINPSLGNLGTGRNAIVGPSASYKSPPALYIESVGGIGKTLLVEELHYAVKFLRSPDLIDFYDIHQKARPYTTRVMPEITNPNKGQISRTSFPKKREQKRKKR